jgi:hypothetical protein
MIPGALALRGDYKDLTLPVIIIAGDGDRVVFKRRSEQLRDSIEGSELQIVKGAGHMVHHLAPRQVARAIESVAEASRARPSRSNRGSRAGRARSARGGVKASNSLPLGSRSRG